MRQRHQEKAGKQAKEPRRPRAGTQLSPTGSPKLPQIRLPANQRIALYGFAAVLFVAVVVFLLGRVRNQEAELQPNAIWVGTEWTYEVHEDAELMLFVEQLKARQIGTIYAQLSWLQPDATWNGADRFDTVKTFVAQFKRLYPESQLLSWITFPVDVGQGYRLDQVTLQDMVIQFSEESIAEFGFDGVFLYVSPVLDGDENFLSIVRRVRGGLPDDAILAAAVPPDWTPDNADIPVPSLYAPGTIWSQPYKQSIALIVDQIAIMGFDSGLTSSSDYTLWLAYQVAAYADAVAALGSDLTTEIIVGLPAHDSQMPLHDPLVESVTSAADGIILGIRQAGEAGRLVRGAGMYTGWMADESDWAQFEQAWLRRAP
jgi:hypothetical protein